MADFPATSFVARGFKSWDQDEFDDRLKRVFAARQFAAPGAVDAPEPEAEVLESMYSDGFAGVRGDLTETAAFESVIEASGGSLDGKAIADANGLSGAGENKLSLTFTLIERVYPGCLPGVAQGRGSCVAHNQKNANLATLCAEIVAGLPDEVTGLIEGPPKIDPDGVRIGAFSTEAIYWYRGYNGDGWTCEASARVSTTSAALWPRNDYPELGVDFRKYSASYEGKYGARKPPEEFTSAGRKNLFRTATRLRSFAEVRDYCANGYGVSSCGGEGFSSTRDENGVSKRSGSWSHAMAILGADDREVVKQKYGGPLVLVMNSWAKWNRGPRRILGTNIDIPEGAFWARWSDVSRRTFIAMGGAAGFPSLAPRLPKINPILG